MDEHEEEDFEQEFDEDGFDPTKEAFFSDLIGMEEDIASEAYELVEHAISLIDTKYYDDSIEVLRQAIGLYTQINREEEIKAINDKISEVYLLKEKAFMEDEIETEQEVEIASSFEVPDERLASDLKAELAQEEQKIDLLANAAQLINDGKNLVRSTNFEEALDKYDEAVGIFEKMNKADEVERVFKLIEECYNTKAEFLRNVKTETPKDEIELEKREVYDKEQLKDEKIEQYLTSKKREEEISNQAYVFLGQAAELAKDKKYNESLLRYEEGKRLFQELGWDYEVSKVEETITQLKEEQSISLKPLVEEGVEEKIEPQRQQVDIIDQQIIEREEQERMERLERLRGIELQKMETEYFKAQIDNMATEAVRMAREYELAMQKAIKKGELIEECIYPQVIDLYKRIKELLIDKGWSNEAAIYDDTIDIYIQKFEQDKKVREIEAEKITKQKQAEELLKVKESEETTVLEEIEQQKLDQLHKIEIETGKIRAEITEMTDRADRLAREYEVALRKGKFELKCPYPEIIEMYRIVRQKSLERGWETEATIHLSQIQAYTEKLEKDRNLRKIEAEKAIKQKQAEDILKIQTKEKKPAIDEEKLKIIEEQKILGKEVEFEKMTNELVKKAEEMARTYDLNMKKAVRRGELAENPPFEEIIKIYERAKQMAVAKGRNEEAMAYTTHINYYSQQWEKDIKLREIEYQKIQRQKEIEEMHKVSREDKLDTGQLVALEKKKEEAEFERYITNMVDKAEKMVREHEIEMRKAMRKGEIVETTPYEEVIDIYNIIREKVYARGWREQADIFANQIKIYKDKMEKHNKLLEVEAQKIQKQKEIEEIQKVSREDKLDTGQLVALEKKKEEAEFERYITNMVDKAEKMVREHEIEMRKAMRKGEIVETTPYEEVIDIYNIIREKVYARGWREQADIFANQIKIYKDKMEKHNKLLEIEAQKVQKEKDLDSVQKVEKTTSISQEKMKKIAKKKEDKEFQNYILEMVNDAEKLEREYDSAMKKALKKGEFIEKTPYPEIIEIYREIQNKLLERGWVDQSQIYFNQIKIYQEKLKKSEILREVEAKKAKRQKELEDMYKVKEEFKPVRPEKIKELEGEETEQDKIIDRAMKLIDEAEELVKNYEINIKTDVLLYESPYDNAISNYTEAKKLFQEIGWNEEAIRLIDTIKFYKDKEEKDEKLREIEQDKLKEPEKKLIAAKINAEKELLAKEKRIIEFEASKKEETKLAEKIFDEIHNAERMAQEYELKIKDGNFDTEPPYEEILKIYRNARSKFEEIGWMEESMKLLNPIQFYKDKLEKDNRLRSLELEKAKRQEQELLAGKKLLAQAKAEQERILKERKESLLQREEEEKLFESTKDDAFRLMDHAKMELKQNNFEKAIELYKASEEIFIQIEWQEGINMVRDSITMIKRKQEFLELEKQAIEKKRMEEIRIEEQLEEKLVKAKELRKLQQEQKRKELIKVQNEKQRERKISEEAYEILKQGTKLLDKKRFDEAYEKYIEARKLFDSISWKREVSRINNDLLYKLQRERKAFEALEDIKKKKVEEQKALEAWNEETAKEQRELAKKQKEEKRRLEREKFDQEILKEVERAEKLIEAYKFNEGVKILKIERNKLERSGKRDEIKRIDEIIKKIEGETQVPIITSEPLEKYGPKLEAAYKALDKAQSSIISEKFMKAISELKESKFNLLELKFNEKYIKKIDDKIHELQEKLGKSPKSKKGAPENERDLLKDRIAAIREERKKRLKLLLEGKK